MLRVAIALTATILGSAPASAADIWLEKSVFYYGEPILVRYDTEGALFNDIALSVIKEDRAEHVLQIPRGNSEEKFGEIILLCPETSSAFCSWDVLSRPRNLFSFTWKSAEDYQPHHVFFWVLRPQASRPGTLVLDQERIVQGESLGLTIHGLETLLAENDAGNGANVRLLLVRLGHYLPGGAVLPDWPGTNGHKYGDYALKERITLGEEDEPGGRMFRSNPEGHYELRLIGATGALIDRASFTIMPPNWQGALRLEPPRDEPYVMDPNTGEGRPTIYLDRDLGEVGRLLDGSNNYELPEIVVYQMFDDNRGLNEAESYDLLEAVANAVPAIDDYSMPVLAGPYEVWLQVPYNLHQAFVADRIGYAMGGESIPYPRREPPLFAEDLSLTLHPGERVEVGSLLSLTVGLPAGIDVKTRDIWATMHFRPAYSFDCLLLVGTDDNVYQYSERLILEAEGRIDFIAPSVPGRWELRLWEPNAYQREDYYFSPDPTYLGRIAFDTEMPALPGALTWVDEPSIGEPLRVRYEVPPEFPYDNFEIQLLSSSELLPGGSMPWGQFTSWRKPEEGHGGVVEFPPVFAPGLYELHLTVRGQSIDSGEHREFAVHSYLNGYPVVDRLAFHLSHPGAPPLPADYAYRRSPELDPLPEEGDPRRGLAVWWPAFDDCQEPQFSQPPKLLLTERLIGDPDDPSDDLYEPVTSPFPGHPYFIEAHFEEAPPEERYRVNVGETDRIAVWRTADPLVYRSELVTFLPEGSE